MLQMVYSLDYFHFVASFMTAIIHFNDIINISVTTALIFSSFIQSQRFICKYYWNSFIHLQNWNLSRVSTKHT